MGYNREQSPLHSKSYSFALRVVKMIKYLPYDAKLQSLYSQILRSGTSVAANVREAEFAQSPSDFISKMSISLKEANETMFWLNLLKDSDCISTEQFDSMSSDCNELVSMLVSSIKTAKINKDLIK